MIYQNITFLDYVRIFPFMFVYLWPCLLLFSLVVETYLEQHLNWSKKINPWTQVIYGKTKIVMRKKTHLLNINKFHCNKDFNILNNALKIIKPLFFLVIFVKINRFLGRKTEIRQLLRCPSLRSQCQVLKSEDHWSHIIPEA